MAAALALAWAGLSAGAGVTALARAARARPTPSGPLPGRILLVRPCAGHEPGLEQRLVSALATVGEARPAVRFSVASADDPAVEAITAAMGRLSAAGVEVELVLAPPIGPNRKTSQLAAAAPPGAADLVICADSDVDLTGLNLDLLLRPLALGAGACWAPPVERGPLRGVGDRASQAVLGGSLHSFPLLSRLDPAGLVGKLFAVRGDALEAAGGFRGLVRHLGEDMELARRLRLLGWRVEVAPMVAPSMASGRAPREVVARYARWLQVIRAQRPALLVTYPAFFFCWPLQTALAITSLDASSAMAGAALLIALLGRLIVALGAARLAGRPLGLGSALVDMALSDLTLGLAWLGALMTRRFQWRGVPLRIGRGGELVGGEG